MDDRRIVIEMVDEADQEKVVKYIFIIGQGVLQTTGRLKEQ